MVKELCCAINRDFLQTRRQGDDTNVIFWWEGSECSVRNTTYTKIWDIWICVEFLTYLKAKYMLFFSAQRVFRYAGMDVNYNLLII